MRALTPGERRGALIVVLLLALGAARDLVVARFAPDAPPPASPIRIAEPGSGGPAAAPGPMPAPGARLDLNRADSVALDALPGIGPVLAGRILAHRRRVGAFRSADELRAVRGVGPRLLERLRPFVFAVPETTADAARRAVPRAPAAVQPARPGRSGAADSAQVAPARVR